MFPPQQKPRRQLLRRIVWPVVGAAVLGAVGAFSLQFAGGRGQIAESVRVETRGLGIGVSVVSPGPVDTAFFERAGHAYERRLPRKVRPERVARWIVRAIRYDLAQVFVPTWLAFPSWLHGAVPILYRRLSRFQ